MAGPVGYSLLDRILHRIAFAGPGIQRAAAEIEDRSLAAVWSATAAPRPVFITSLPRAGTTILLEALSRLPGVATHRYRDMPFVMAPVLWARLSTRFRRPAELHERAHGDGIEIGYDSPEAFEEILWRAFWPEKYRGNAIALSTAGDRSAEGEAFLAAHMRKIVALRCPEDPAGARYVSKNNGNIARLGLLSAAFPAAPVIVPFRAPLEHAWSMLRQHRNFAALHARDRFALRYMADLGHYEFGVLHRPIRFAGLDDLVRGLGSDSLDYWLAYWIAAFEHVLAGDDAVVLLRYEEFAASGAEGLAALCERCGLAPCGAVERAAAILHQAPPPRAEAAMLAHPERLDRALDIEAALARRAH